MLTPSLVTFYSLRCTGKEFHILLSGVSACPGLFYATPAQDGILSRIRVPGGILRSQQLCAIADIAQDYGGGYADVTNRANLQIREIQQGFRAKVLRQLQDLGLGSQNPAVDHIRNIMTSPTAGIDVQEVIDTRPFVQGWENYIKTQSAWSGLSAKFSVCFDGGGTVSVCDRLNDIMLAAALIDGQVYFRLCLSVGAKGELPKDTGILFPAEKYLSVLATLTDVYLQHTDTTSRRKLRFREMLNSLGGENYLQQVQQRLPFALKCTDVVSNISNNYRHLGIHPQRQVGLFYIGVVLPLGRLKTPQMRGLADIVTNYGSGTLRLTPWQNLLITDIPQRWVANVVREIAVLGLDCSPSNINGTLVACSGKQGCAASATDTKAHALTSAAYLNNHMSIDRPVNIHFSGCPKSCAQHSNSDIALLGVNLEDNTNEEGYHIYVGDGENNQQFGRQLYQGVSVRELPGLLKRMLQVYHSQKLHPDESFGEFANRHAIADLQHLFTSPITNPKPHV